MDQSLGAGHGAHRLTLDDQRVVFRITKTTPTKIGQFVTLWKRPKPDEFPSAAGNKPAALHTDDRIGFVVVHVHDDSHSGQSIFNRSILVDKGTMATGSKKGKTAFRIYPPWTKPVADEAIKSQRWQNVYFVADNENEVSKLDKVRKLFNKTKN